MSGEPYDRQGEVRDALNQAVDGYGKRVLNDPRVLGNLVTDLLPDLPRERSLLVTAAEAGIAAELTQNVEGQHMDADTAVALAARSLTEARSLDPAASTWVATEYARALGYQVRSQSPPPQLNDTPPVSDPPPTLPPYAPTQTSNSPGFWQDGLPQATTPPQNPWPPQAPPQNQWPSQNQWPPQPPPQDPWSPQAPPQNPWPPQPPAGPGGVGGSSGPGGPWQPAPGPGGPWPSSTPPARSRPRRGALLWGGAAAAVVVVYLVIAATASAFPFSRTTPTPAPASSVTTPRPLPSSPSPSPSLHLAAGVKPLTEVMPTDLEDMSTECHAQQDILWTNPGLVQALKCQDPNLAGGQVFGYQMDSAKDYLQAWANYNSWANFGTSNTLDCPPDAGDSEGGPADWWDNAYPKRNGQVLECFTGATDSGPVYVWTYPTEDTFIVAQPPKSYTFAKLDTWWNDNTQ
jgi:hypothetical protein